MFQISVEREFCAAHALVIAGSREPVHGHNFQVTCCVEGRELDADGLLMDFHALEKLLDDVLKPMVNQDLNALRSFVEQKINPSAEQVARYIAQRVAEGLPMIGPKDGRACRVAWVRLTEAPGCSVVYTTPLPGGNDASVETRRSWS